MRHFPKLKNLTRCAPGTCNVTAPPRLIFNPSYALCVSAVKAKIVKIGELADFRRFRSRCTRDLRKAKSAYADFRSRFDVLSSFDICKLVIDSSFGIREFVIGSGSSLPGFLRGRILDSGRQRAFVGAFYDAEGSEKKSRSEVNGVIAGVELDQAGNNRKRRVLADNGPKETDHEIANGKRHTKLLANRRPRAHRRSEQDQAQDDVRQIMREGVVMFVVAARNVEKRENTEHHVQNACDNQNRFPPLAPHAPSYVGRANRQPVVHPALRFGGLAPGRLRD